MQDQVGRTSSPWHHPHTQATKAEASEQKCPPTPTSARRPGPSLLAPFLGGRRASCPSASPSPSTNPMEPRRGQPAGGLRPDPDTPPLTLLQELQTQSHEGRRGSETQRPAKTEKGRGRDKGAESRETGGRGRGSKGAKSPGQKGAGSKRGLQHKSLHHKSGEATETEAGVEAGKAKRGTPTPRSGGWAQTPEREQGETATETNQEKAGRGEVWELGSFAGVQRRA